MLGYKKLIYLTESHQIISPVYPFTWGKEIIRAEVCEKGIENCNCGIHGSFEYWRALLIGVAALTIPHCPDLDIMDSRNDVNLRMMITPSPDGLEVVALIRPHGKVVLHQSGFRAEQAEIAYLVNSSPEPPPPRIDWIPMIMYTDAQRMVFSEKCPR